MRTENKDKLKNENIKFLSQKQ